MRALLCCLDRVLMKLHGAVRRLIFAPYLHLDSVELIAPIPCNSPSWCLLFPPFRPTLEQRLAGDAPKLCPRFFNVAQLKSSVLMSAPFSSAVFLSWPTSCFATSRLFADVLLRCAETTAHVLGFGGLLNFDLTKRYFKPKESCFDVPGISSQHCAHPGSKVLLWQKRSCGTAARPLSNASLPLFQLRIERSFCSFSWLLHSVVTISRNGLTAFNCLSPRSSRPSTFDDASGVGLFGLFPAAGQGDQAGGGLKIITPPSSVSSNSQDFVGVSHGFFFL